MITDLDCLKIIVYTAKPTTDKTEARETILQVRKTINHVKIDKPNISFNPEILIDKASSVPRPVAMPLPPLNFKNIVQLCPQIQVMLKAINNSS